MVEQAFRSKGTTYSQIMSLDQKLRNHPVPTILEWPWSQDELQDCLSISVGLAMQRYMRVNLQESSLYYILSSQIMA